MGQETYEVWLHKAEGTWHQILDREAPVFEQKKRALAVAGAIAQREDSVAVVVFERRVLIELNGPATVAPPGKKRLALVEEERETPRSPTIRSQKPES